MVRVTVTTWFVRQLYIARRVTLFLLVEVPRALLAPIPALAAADTDYFAEGNHERAKPTILAHSIATQQGSLIVLYVRLSRAKK